MRSEIYKGFKKAVPIMIGYWPVAMAYGFLAKNAGLSLLEAGAMSIIVFAGASQFMGVKLIMAGIAGWEIVVATFLLNLRHLLMSASLSVKYDKFSKPWKILLAFGVTDETFSVASNDSDGYTPGVALGLEFFSYLAWFGGSVSGHFLGAALPGTLQSAMSIALYSLFAALLAPQIKGKLRLAVIAVFAGGLNSLFVLVFSIPTGWSFVLSMIVVSIAGTFIISGKEVKQDAH